MQRTERVDKRTNDPQLVELRNPQIIMMMRISPKVLFT